MVYVRVEFTFSYNNDASVNIEWKIKRNMYTVDFSLQALGLYNLLSGFRKAYKRRGDL